MRTWLRAVFLAAALNPWVSTLVPRSRLILANDSTLALCPIADGAMPLLGGARALGGDCVWVRRLGRNVLLGRRCCGGSVDRSAGPALPRAGAACHALYDRGAP